MNRDKQFCLNCSVIELERIRQAAFVMGVSCSNIIRTGALKEADDILNPDSGIMEVREDFISATLSQHTRQIIARAACAANVSINEFIHTCLMGEASRVLETKMAKKCNRHHYGGDNERW